MSASGSNFGARDLSYKKRKVASFIDDRIRVGITEFQDENTLDLTDLQTRTGALETTTSTLQTKTSTLESKTEYLTKTTGQSEFQGVLKATGFVYGQSFSVGNSVPGQSGYFLPLSKPNLTNYALITPPITGNTLQFVPYDYTKIQNMTSILNNSTSFVGDVSASGNVISRGNVTVVNTTDTTSYSLPNVGPNVIGSALLATNTTGTLAWCRPSMFRSYRLDTTSQQTTATFPVLNTQLNILQLTTTNVIDGEFELSVPVGSVRYIGTQTRTFIASCSVYFRGETKNQNQQFILRMSNTTTGLVLASSRFIIEEDIVAQHEVFGVGLVATNNLINVVLLNTATGQSVSVGSPNFSIILN